MRVLLIAFFLLLMSKLLLAQHFAAGVETYTGVARTSFRGSLPEIVGFSELSISESDVNTAFARFGLDGPNWLKRLFTDVRIEVDGELAKQLTRNVQTTRFYARYRFIGGSFSISDPRLATPEESKKLKNQVKSLRLALNGDALELAEHLAIMAALDEIRVKPFFNNRYDLEGYIDLGQLLLPDAKLIEWGKNSSVGLHLVGGMRFTADPSPVVDLGSILFVSERLSELVRGSLLSRVENTTDKIAVAIQNVVFGRFRDPRTVPSVGWFTRVETPVNFGGDFSLLLGTELSMQRHTSIRGVQPMYSAYGYAGMRWGILGRKKG